MRLVDISQEVFSCQVYPGDPAPEVKWLVSMEQGACYNLSGFSMCAHNGTHIDAPRHFIKDGKCIDAISLDCVVGDCYVIRHEGNMNAREAMVAMKKAEAAGAGERLLIAGDVTVTEEAATVFAQFGLKLIGNEGQSVGPEEAPMRVHRILLGADVVLLEGIVLSEVTEGKYFLHAAPLNFAGFDGSPCRAYLICE